MVLYLWRMCQCGLHAVLWSRYYGSSSLRNLAVPQDLYSSLSVSVYLADPVLDGLGLASFKSRANAIFYWHKLLYPFLSSNFPFLFFVSICWYCGAGVFALIGCRSLSPTLALPTSFNNNKRRGSLDEMPSHQGVPSQQRGTFTIYQEVRLAWQEGSSQHSGRTWRNQYGWWRMQCRIDKSVCDQSPTLLRSGVLAAPSRYRSAVKYTSALVSNCCNSQASGIWYFHSRYAFRPDCRYKGIKINSFPWFVRPQKTGRFNERRWNCDRAASSVDGWMDRWRILSTVPCILSGRFGREFIRLQ